MNYVGWFTSRFRKNICISINSLQFAVLLNPPPWHSQMYSRYLEIVKYLETFATVAVVCNTGWPFPIRCDTKKWKRELHTDSRVIKYNGSFIALASCSVLTSLEFNHSSRELNLFCPARALRLSPRSKTLFTPDPAFRVAEIGHSDSCWMKFLAHPSYLSLI